MEGTPMSRGPGHPAGAADIRARRERGTEMVAVHARDDTEVDALRADRLALAVERAPAEAFLVGGAHHGSGAPGALGLALGQEPEVGELGPHEEGSGPAGTSGAARAAADAFRRIERALGHRAREGHRIGLRPSARADRTGPPRATPA